ncbi:hypothetical protein [Flaviaesturariibacter terrae]
MNTIIFSRPVHSGKTTELAAWCAAHPEVRGVLMPDSDGERYFLDLGSGKRWPANARNDGDALPVGRFRLSAAAFRKACDSLAANRSAHWLVIDEVGKAELGGEGFAGALRSLLLHPSDGPRNLLLVVRDYLLHDVIEAFGLQEARVVGTLDGIWQALGE